MDKIDPNVCSTGVTMPPLPIPQHWSPEQALAVWEFLDAIADHIWACYELPITELLRRETGEAMPQADLFDEDITF